MPESYLAACAIFRNEAPYLAEWIDFHRLVGVDRFFLYDNGSDDGSLAVLAPYIAEGWVSVEPWPMPFRLPAARLAYADCLARARGRTRWLTCLDIDEFLFAPQEPALPPVLRRFEQAPGVVVRWQVYGSSGHQGASDEPVIGRFAHRAPTQWIRNRRVKSIVDPVRALGPVNPHHFVYAGGARAVDETGTPVDLVARWRLGKAWRRLHRWLGPARRHVDPWAATDISRQRVSVEHLRINHYPVKSRAEFERKARKMEGKGRYDGVDYFAYHDRNEVFDPILFRYLPRLGGSPRPPARGAPPPATPIG